MEEAAKMPTKIRQAQWARIPHLRKVAPAPQSTPPSLVAYSQAREIFRVCQTNYWMIMVNGWTWERRAKQAELIRQWKPWKQSTGPKSTEGKARIATNA